MLDIRSTTGTAIAMTVTSKTASTNGSTVDLQGYNSAMVTVITNTVTAADGTNTITFKLQDSPDGSTWTDVPIGGFTGSALINATSQANTIIGSLGYTPTAGAAQRYLRIVATVAGTVSAIFGAVAILQGGRVK